MPINAHLLNPNQAPHPQSLGAMSDYSNILPPHPALLEPTDRRNRQSAERSVGSSYQVQLRTQEKRRKSVYKCLELRKSVYNCLEHRKSVDNCNLEKRRKLMEIEKK